MSSPSQPSPKNDEAPDHARLSALALRTTIGHALLLLVTSFAESNAFVQNGWNASVPLLSVFIAGPVLFAFLYRSGQRRIASVLMLGILPAACWIHVQTLLSLSQTGSLSPTQGAPAMVYMALLIMLAAISLGGSLVSFTLLRAAHAPSSPSPEVHP